MIKHPSLEIGLSPCSSGDFSLDEVTFNPFILSANEVHLWMELVLRNTSKEPSKPPRVLLRFDRPVKVENYSLQRALSPDSKRFLEPAKGLEYVAIGDLNLAMFGEIWHSYIDVLTSLPPSNGSHALERNQDLFSMVYRDAIRVVSDKDAFIFHTNTLLRTLRSSCECIFLEESSQRGVFRVRAKDRGDILIEVEEDSRANGPFVMRRAPWKTAENDVVKVFRGLCFVGFPKLLARDEGSTWEVTPIVRRRSEQQELDPNESVRFWLRWTFPEAVAEGACVAPSVFGDEIVFYHDVCFADQVKCYCLNSFVRISPEFSFASAADGDLSFRPVPSPGEIFTEWRWYSNTLVGRLLKFVQEGARQYYASRVHPPQLVRVAASFRNTLSEPRRLARILVFTVLIGILTNFLASELMRLAHPSESIRLAGQEDKGPWIWMMFILLNMLGLFGLTAYTALDYFHITKNPILEKLVRRHPESRSSLVASWMQKLSAMSLPIHLKTGIYVFVAVWAWTIFTYLGIRSWMNRLVIVVAVLLVLLTLQFGLTFLVHGIRGGAK